MNDDTPVPFELPAVALRNRRSVGRRHLQAVKRLLSKHGHRSLAKWKRPVSTRCSHSRSVETIDRPRPQPTAHTVKGFRTPGRRRREGMHGGGSPKSLQGGKRGRRLRRQWCRTYADLASALPGVHIESAPWAAAKVGVSASADAAVRDESGRLPRFGAATVEGVRYFV
jgi:hypothetical protein